MDKCYVCKSNRRQLLMLSCSHDVCIKCAADNYFLNTINVKDKKKQQKKQQKKESYFCEICLQVTKIDQNTINQLKQWYIKNVNSKNQSKVASKSKDRNKQQVGRFGEQKVVMKSKPRQQQKTQYKMYHNSKNNFRHQQQRQDEYEQRNYHMMRYDNNNNNIKKNINNDNNIKKNMISNNNKNNQPNSNKFNNNNKKKYIMFEQQQQQKNRNTNQLILDSYYQRFSYNPYQSHYVVNNNNDNDNKNVDINNNNKNVDINNDNNHINNNINNHVNNHINKKRSPPSISQSKQSSQVSKQRQRAFGSITRRDSLSTNNNNVNNNNNKNTNAYNNNNTNKNSYQYQPANYHNEQQHKRRRIQSYRSQQKCNTVPIQGRIGQRTTIRRQKSNYFQEKQQQQQQQITTPRNLLVYAQQKNNNNNNNSNKKKKQVYLDLIGYQHSLQQSQQQYQQQQRQQQQNYHYHHHQSYKHSNKQKEQNNRNHDYNYRYRSPTTKGNQHSQRKQIINKFNQHQPSLSQVSQNYHKYQQQLNNTITTPTSVKSPKTIDKNQYKHNQNNHKLYCNIHQDEEIIYYCLQCKLLICSQCALYGQHKEHNMHTLKKAAFKLKQTLYLLITEMNSYQMVQEQKQQILLEQIEQLKVQSNKQKQKVKHAFENFIKNIQNKYAQILQQLQQSQTLSISGFNKQLQITRKRCKQFYQTKASMQKLFQSFSKNQNTNNLLIGEVYSNCDSMKNIIGNCGGSTSASNTNKFGVVDGRGNNNSNIYSNNYNNFNNNSNNRMYRQFDDCFQQNKSMTSSQRNYINTNIEELQSKISQYEENVKKYKPQYQKVIYPTLYIDNKNNLQLLQSNKNIIQVKKSKQFFRQRSKSRKQSLQLHESLKLSQTSSLLLNQPSQQSPKNNKRIKYDNFIDDQDFIQENNLKSLNLIIEKQLFNQQQLKESIKLCHVDTIVESIKQIQEIIKQFRIQQRVYEIKAGRKQG